MEDFRICSRNYRNNSGQIISKGEKVKVIGVSDDGYDIESESGIKIYSIGWGI